MRRPGCRHVCVVIGAFGAALASIGCDAPDVPPRADSATATTAAVPPSGARTNGRVPAVGSLLVVPGDSAGVGIVIFPDAPSAQLVASGPLQLLAPNGDSAIAPATLVQGDSQVCGEAPLLRIQDSVATAWSVGIAASLVAPVRLDSIEAFSRPDSTRLVAELARLASTIPMQTDSRFKGLPFAVSSARRFEIDGRHVVVSQLVRRVPHEAAPVEEHTFIIAERDSARAPLVMSFHQRSEGTEDTAEQFEILAVVRGRDGVWLLLSRDNTAQTTYEVLERSGPAAWRQRWSRVLSC
jgi:hypothetical protein